MEIVNGLFVIKLLEKESIYLLVTYK